MNSRSNKGGACVWLRKELMCEFRSKQGLLNSLVFGFMAVVVAVFATAQQQFSPDLAAGFLVSILVFSAVVTVPRIFLVEEDQKTFDLARLMADSATVYVGKALFSTGTLAVSGAGLAVVFALMTKTDVDHWEYLVGGAILFSIGLGQCLSLTSSLVLGAQNRAVLSGVVALPLVLPLVFCGVGAVRFGFGEGAEGAALRNVIVMFGYAAGLAALGPVLVGAVWGGRGGPGGVRLESSE